MHPSSLHLSILLGCLGLAPLAAQSRLVSPSYAATAEGISQNRAPFGDVVARRYQQIHSDLGSSPKSIRKLAFRRNGTETNGTGTSQFDLELRCGDTVPWDRARFVFGTNWLATPTLVVARKVMNVGPLTSTATPAAFEVAFAFDAPYAHSGSASFGWEVVLFANTVTGTFPLLFDAEVGSPALATTTALGAGCIATGQTAPLTHTLSAGDVSGVFQLGGLVANAPANAPLFLALGVADPDLAVQGLCSNLRTDLAAIVPLGNADATGFLGATANGSKFAGGTFVLALANTFAGAPLYTQVHALDLASTWPVQITNSEGRTFAVPAQAGNRAMQVTRVFNTDGGTNAQNALFFVGSTMGYGLVTEVTYQ